MGKFLDKFKSKSDKAIQGVGEYINKERDVEKNYNTKRLNPNNKESIGSGFGIEDDSFTDEDFYEEDMNKNYNDFDDVGIQPAQKPESFHHFILENQYKDLERSIRGLKDVWDSKTRTWKTKRKELHCFTDEEAEDILRTAQSHLATDIKLGFIKKESFGDYMDAVYKELGFLFESIAEYRYGRYGDFERQYKMKLQNQKIFLELFTRVQANYSRAIAGAENRATHGSVRGQESLQSSAQDLGGYNRGYS